MKKDKKYKQAHTDNVKNGMGDYYGSGVRQKVGRMRDGVGAQVLSKSKLGKPPKSLA